MTNKLCVDIILNELFGILTVVYSRELTKNLKLVQYYYDTANTRFMAIQMIKLM